MIHQKTRVDSDLFFYESIIRIAALSQRGAEVEYFRRFNHSRGVLTMGCGSSRERTKVVGCV